MILLVLIVWILQTILGVIVIKKNIDKETPFWMALLVSAFVFFNLIVFIYWIGLTTEKLLKLK
jgi:hypothetical protein